MKPMLKNIIAENPAIDLVLATLNTAGYNAHLVGGTVRDCLMGIPAKDFDIATNARPDRVTSLFEAQHYQVYPTGIAHGTVTAVVDGTAFEITTWRQDVATDGRRATVAYSDSIQEDAARRDFTFNALYADRAGNIIDPTNLGLEDAKNRVVRFIGSPHARIKEDALRILRYFRFSQTIADGVEAASEDLTACAVLAHLVNGLSRERVGQEMLRMLSGVNFSKIAFAMHEAGVLKFALPAYSEDALVKLPHLEVIEASMGLAPCPIRRLAFLQKRSPKEDLALSKIDAKFHALLTSSEEDGLSPNEMGYFLGAATAEDVLCLTAARKQDCVSASDIQRARVAAEQKFPVKATDLIERFQGKDLGSALRHAENSWVQSKFQKSRETLILEI